ncbi:ganglioside GM2 activator-like isoform X2 [Montipora foliosa]|uniref:ganglioside GM2 activator-like isoform X2 n=1 Tax=Montipora foliosa TaxID=591990 RepID=UPI0035F21824
MAFAQIFVALILAFAVDALEWKNCDRRAPVQIQEINLSPEPVILKKGSRITLSGKFRVYGDVGEKYQINLTIKKSAFWGWLRVPCFGKCTRNVDCSQLINLLEGEKCPLSPKQYVVNERTVVLPDLKLPSFITKGTYKIKADVKDREKNRKISCLEVTVKVQ